VSTIVTPPSLAIRSFQCPIRRRLDHLDALDRPLLQPDTAEEAAVGVDQHDRGMASFGSRSSEIKSGGRFADPAFEAGDDDSHFGAQY
jgi:hypothetical protein